MIGFVYVDVYEIDGEIYLKRGSKYFKVNARDLKFNDIFWLNLIGESEAMRVRSIYVMDENGDSKKLRGAERENWIEKVNKRK